MKETKFKQTEVGMIPSDWEVKFLSEIGSFSKGSGISRSESNSGNLPAIRYGEIYTKHNDYIKVFYSHVSKEVANKSTRIYQGDVLFSASGETKEDIGKTVAFLEPIEAYAGGDIIIMSPKCPVNSMFLGYILNFPTIAKQKAIKAQGDAVVHITTDSLRKLQVCIPKTTKEQQRIANALSDVDTLIANLEKLIAKKKNIKQGAMQQLLTGRKRLPGFAPAKPTYKQTELGKIPTDWEFVPVSELAKDMADGPFGSNLKKEHYTSDPQARIIQLSNIGENGWEDENTKYTTFEHAKTIARCIVPKEESILVAKMMPAGRAIICPKIEKQYVLGSDVIRITANEKLNSKYFVYASKSDVYLKQISDNTQGSTRQRTSISKLRKILILLPSLDEQTAIANVLSDMDTEIATLETKLAKYRKLKTGMMQQLLTGKIRLV